MNSFQFICAKLWPCDMQYPISWTHTLLKECYSLITSLRTILQSNQCLNKENMRDLCCAEGGERQIGNLIVGTCGVLTDCRLITASPSERYYELDMVWRRGNNVSKNRNKKKLCNTKDLLLARMVWNLIIDWFIFKWLKICQQLFSRY